MRHELHGNETADNLIKQLVGLRIVARNALRFEAATRDKCAEWEAKRDACAGAEQRAAAVECIQYLGDQLLELKSLTIDIGRYLMPLCDALDRKAYRRQILDALNVGHADRDSENMRLYGTKALHIVAVLDLENSATKDDGLEVKPLKWCHTRAFMSAMQTSEKLDRIVHDGANDFFNGAFGEYRERPLAERLVGRSL